jgi:hypothetical protein
MNKPIAICRLRVPPRHRLTVFVWKTKREMLHYANSGRGNKLGHATRAFFRPPTLHIRIGPRGGITVLNKGVGEIHLIHNGFGAGIFAHELQHFLNFWFINNDWDITGRHWERSAYLAGDLTNAFWAWFYDTFERKEDKYHAKTR